jgi:hypothetical protein
VTNTLGNVVRSHLRRGAIGLILVAMLGVQLVDALPSSAGTVTNPAMATIGASSRFTSEIVFDGGVITVRPAPASARTFQGIGAVTAKIWASTQLAGFTHQTLGWGYVTIRGTVKGEKPVKNLLAWVGFANGNTATGCAKDGAGQYRTNGEAAVVLGDATFSQDVSYVPAGCGIASRSGYRIPDEVVSVPWVKVGTANAHGVVTFETTIAQCGVVKGRTIVRSAAVTEVLLYAQRPDWSAKVCSANVLKVGVPLAKTAAQANALRLTHGTSGPVRQVVNAA